MSFYLANAGFQDDLPNISIHREIFFQINLLLIITLLIKIFISNILKIFLRRRKKILSNPTLIKLKRFSR